MPHPLHQSHPVPSAPPKSTLPPPVVVVDSPSKADRRRATDSEIEDEDEELEDSGMLMNNDPLEGLEHIRPRQYRTNSANSIRAPPSALMQVKEQHFFFGSILQLRPFKG